MIDPLNDVFSAGCLQVSDFFSLTLGNWGHPQFYWFHN